MATIVTVHGTFAHVGGTADALGINENAELQWWQRGSVFEKHTRELVQGDGGDLDIVPFVWNAFNSEISRREAGSSLLKLLRQLEEKNENYCVVAHSHGGSVVASALMESVARGQPLSRLKKWITIGTPFIAMKKQSLLFARLTLTRKVMFVASIMLLIMFAFYATGLLLKGGFVLRSERQLWGLLFSGVMMSLPFVCFYVALRFIEGQELFSYRPRAVRKAQENYAARWLPLTHRNDEAVQGLRCLPDVKLNIVHEEFAVSTLTLASIFFLPVAYLLLVTSPSAMVGLANFLKDTVYAVDQYDDREGSVAAARQQMRQIQSELRKSVNQSDVKGFDPTKAESRRLQAQELRTQLREARRKLRESHPEFDDVERAMRFKRTFLQESGKPCDGGTLCGAGKNYALNSRLLFHVVTDELSNALVVDDLNLGAFGGVARIGVTVVLVPVVFALLALAMLAVVQYLAKHISGVLSRWLNILTMAEIKRSALGNDTEGEIALAADQRPPWIDAAYNPIPDELGDRIASYSNDATAQSLAKFRNAISTLAFSEGSDSKAGVISNYLTWKELIHATYFDVPEFRKLVARAIGETEGFKVSESFKSDPQYETTAAWLAALVPKTETAEPTPSAA
jgi:hypothetical protein